MSLEKIKFYRITCDFCSNTEKLEKINGELRKKQWINVSFGYKPYDLCLLCQMAGLNCSVKNYKKMFYVVLESLVANAKAPLVIRDMYSSSITNHRDMFFKYLPNKDIKISEEDVNYSEEFLCSHLI